MMTEEVVKPKEDASGIGTSEHDKAMIAKSDETIEQAVQKVEPTKTEERPEWLPEKYKSVEDFLEGHKSLEKKLGEREEVTPTDESEGEVTPTDEGEAKVGTLDQFFDEYAATGEVSEASILALEKLGYSRDVVNTYVKGFEAQVATISAKAHEIVGGEEEYTAMSEWAVDTMTPEQLDAYHAQLQSGGDTWELALRGLHAKYMASGDAPVERIRSDGKAPVDTGIRPFTSQEELTTATRSKEYKTSPEYRKMVEARLAISDDATMGANIPQAYASHG
jgi:hypothetical protein